MKSKRTLFTLLDVPGLIMDDSLVHVFPKGKMFVFVIFLKKFSASYAS